MTILEVSFWLLVSFVGYTYFGYPALMLLLSRYLGKPVQRSPQQDLSISVVITARNEAGTIQRRLREMLRLLDQRESAAEIIVVSDGSTDATVLNVQKLQDPRITVLDLAENLGKAAALSLGCRAAQHEILVFADVRQRWAPDALDRLLENFHDPEVGAVSGDLVVESGSGVLAGVGAYWRFEKKLRRAESDLHSMISVTGAISAVRRSLFRAIPQGTLLDDVYWPLQVALQRYRVVHDSRAQAFDRLPDQVHDEFRRKVRTLTGNFQLLMLLPSALLPWRNPAWFQLLSHKVLRLLIPWALLGAFITSWVLPGSLYEMLFWMQFAGYSAGILTAATHVGKRVRIVSLLGTLLVLNAAAWIAFWVWGFGRSTKCWHKVAYRPDETAPPSGSVAEPDPKNRTDFSQPSQNDPTVVFPGGTLS